MFQQMIDWVMKRLGVDCSEIDFGDAFLVEASGGGGASVASPVAAAVPTQVLIEKAGGGKLTVATAGKPVKVKLSALDAKNVVVAGFAGKVALTSTNKVLLPDPMESHPFTAGVLDNFDITFKKYQSKTVLTAELDGIKS